MSFKASKGIHSVSWGIPLFDTITNGLPEKDISVIETPDYYVGQVVLGHFVYEGLKRGEKCVFVTYDSVMTFHENFLNWNLHFEEHLKSGNLVLLNYRPNISTEIGLTHNYEGLFEEILRLCGPGTQPTRIAIQQIDTLINLNNIILMNQSAQKLSSSNLRLRDTTVLGQFVQFKDKTHKDLAIALQKTVKGFFSLERPKADHPHQFQMTVKKIPWFKYVHYPVEMDLIEGEGFGGAEVMLHGKGA